MNQLATPKMVILLTPLASLGVGVTGIMFLGWDWREMVVLYWLYNFTAGILALIAIARSEVGTIKRKKHSPGVQIPPKFYTLTKVGMSIFFIFHYGLFTVVHGVFVFALVNGEFTNFSLALEPFDVQPLLLGWLVVTVTSIIAALFVPVESQPVNNAVSDPYKRIVVLHVAIILGAFILATINLPAFAALILVALNSLFEFVWAKNQIKESKRITELSLSTETPSVVHPQSPRI